MRVSWFANSLFMVLYRKEILGCLSRCSAISPILLLSLFLVGCGGGGSSSGVANSYAGVYTGSSTITLRGLGDTYSETLSLRVVVGVDGRVDVSTPGSTGATCNSAQGATFLSGNKATSTIENVSCSSPGLSCTVSGTLTYTFSSSSASQAGTAVMNCNVGRIDVSYSGFLRKTA